MHEVGLDITKAAASKLRNGHSCRCGLAEGGGGIKAFLSEHNIKKMLKNARKGAKATISLGHDELEHNKMHGSGLMEGGKFKLKHVSHALKKAHVGKHLKDAATSKIGRQVLSGTAAELAGDFMGPEAAPIAYEMSNAALGGKFNFKHAAKKIAHSKPAQSLKKKGIDMLQKRAKEELVKRGVPAGLAGAATKAAAKKADKSTGGKFSFKHAAKKVAHSKPAQELKKKALKKVADEAKKQLIEHGVPPSLAGAATKAASKKADKATGGNFAPSTGGNFPPQSARGGNFPPQTMRGGNFPPQSAYSRGRGVYGASIGLPQSNITNVGAGGTMLSMRNPALLSQPFAANWMFHTQFPPAMAREITG